MNDLAPWICLAMSLQPIAIPNAAGPSVRRLVDLTIQLENRITVSKRGLVT